MVTYRKALPSDRDAYIALADMVFSSEGAPIRFEEFVPKVYSPEVDSAQMHYLAVDDARGIVGLVGALPGKLHAGTTSLRTRYIGTVAVHPRARGEGHMKRLMAMALDDMRADGVDLALLNGQRQRYEHFGFAHGGAMLRFHFSAGCIRHALNRVDAGGVEIEPLHVGSPFIEAAMALHAARPLRFERGGAAEFAVICRTSMRRPWTVSRRGEFLGYLIANREGTAIAEIAAASPEALDIMVKAWFLQNAPQRLEIAVLPTDRAIARRLSSYADGQAMGTCINARALNHRRVLAAMLGAKAALAPMAGGRLELDVDGERLVIDVCDGQADVRSGGAGTVRLTGLEASRLYLAPFDYDGRPNVPTGWFPLPIAAATPDTF